MRQFRKKLDIDSGDSRFGVALQSSALLKPSEQVGFWLHTTSFRITERADEAARLSATVALVRENDQVERAVGRSACGIESLYPHALVVVEWSKRAEAGAAS